MRVRVSERGGGRERSQSKQECIRIRVYNKGKLMKANFCVKPIVRRVS